MLFWPVFGHFYFYFLKINQKIQKKFGKVQKYLTNENLFRLLFFFSPKKKENNAFRTFPQRFRFLAQFRHESG